MQQALKSKSKPAYLPVHSRHLLAIVTDCPNDARYVSAMAQLIHRVAVALEHTVEYPHVGPEVGVAAARQTGW